MGPIIHSQYVAVPQICNNAYPWVCTYYTANTCSYVHGWKHCKQLLSLKLSIKENKWVQWSNPVNTGMPRIHKPCKKSLKDIVIVIKLLLGIKTILL